MEIGRDGLDYTITFDYEEEATTLAAACREELVRRAKRFDRISSWLIKLGLKKEPYVAGLAIMASDSAEADFDELDSDQKYHIAGLEYNDILLAKQSLVNFADRLRTSVAIAESSRRLGVLNNSEIEERFLLRDTADHMLQNIDRFQETMPPPRHSSPE